MRTVDFFEKPAGTRVTMTTANISADVITYVVLVRRWTGGGPLPVATWRPNELENGRAEVLVQLDRGYDFILKASIRPNGNAAMDVRFDFNDGSPAQEYLQEPLPRSEGPVVERKWSLFVEGVA